MLFSYELMLLTYKTILLFMKQGSNGSWLGDYNVERDEITLKPYEVIIGERIRY